MTMAFDPADLSPFMRRHMVATAADPEVMSGLLTSLYAPYQIRTTQKGGGFETSLASTLVKSVRVSCLAYAP